MTRRSRCARGTCCCALCIRSPTRARVSKRRCVPSQQRSRRCVVARRRVASERGGVLGAARVPMGVEAVCAQGEGGRGRGLRVGKRARRGRLPRSPHRCLCHCVGLPRRRLTVPSTGMRVVLLGVANDAQWLNEKDPTEAVLGVVASACKDKKTALELRDERVPRRAISLLQQRETRRWTHQRRLQLLRIVQWSAYNDERASSEYAKASLHTDLLNEVGGAVSVPGQFSEAKSTWVAQLVSTIDSLTMHSAATKDVALKAGCVPLPLLVPPPNARPRASLPIAMEVARPHARAAPNEPADLPHPSPQVR